MIRMRSSLHILRQQVYAYHGTSEQERRVGNRFEVTLRLDYPFERALESDDLSHTANYALLCDIIKEELAIPSKLLEHVAGRIIARCRRQWPEATGGRVAISKLTPPIDAQIDAAVVEVEW